MPSAQAENVATTDSVVVGRLRAIRAIRAIIHGKTNVPINLPDLQSDFLPTLDTR